MEPKRIILERRARFLMAAIAGALPACHKENAADKPDAALIAPEPCLEIIPPAPPIVPPAVADASADAQPRPCLTVVPRVGTPRPLPDDPHKY